MDQCRNGIRTVHLEGSLVSIEFLDRGWVVKTDIKGNVCGTVHPGVSEASYLQFKACPDILWCNKGSSYGVNMLACDCMQAKIGGMILSLQKWSEYQAG